MTIKGFLLNGEPRVSNFFLRFAQLFNQTSSRADNDACGRSVIVIAKVNASFRGGSEKLIAVKTTPSFPSHAHFSSLPQLNPFLPSDSIGTVSRGFSILRFKTAICWSAISIGALTLISS